eukprot:CAMPEP_0117662534 /NCGR_PEP_ID=MMETSP0804-20121206/8103_1 /TAXON_ID=1074897 /ORGANISM="Tetraselmis astigmatica, Strain CCMP880" /LENGTH=501 /DNA_ID=CAMNT_0005469437 /DNA_START=177 /DNA_END=1682 /DNA_ORIENTATION=+
MTGRGLVADNTHFLHSALHSSEYQIRQLGVKQLGAALQQQQQQQQDSQSAATLAAMLADEDVGVAAAAERAILEVARSGPTGLELITRTDSGGCGAKLLQLTGAGSRAEVRLRVLGAASSLAAISPEAMAAVEGAGLLGSLVAELQNPSDVLACVAALEVLQDIAKASAGSGNAAAIAEVFGPVVQPLLAAPQSGQPAVEPFLICQALKVSGSLLSSSSESGRHTATTESYADLFLQAAARLMSIARVGSEDLPDEVHHAVMEAAAAAGQHSLGAERVVRWQAADGSVVQLLAWEALGGRSGHGESRIVSLHALGTLAGAERMRQAGTLSGEAVLSAPAESALRSAVRNAAPAADTAAGNGWVEVLWALLQQPFLELRVACYRLASALALRDWAALQICAHADLRNHICDPKSESGQQGSQWRYAVLQSLVAGCSSHGGRGGPEANGHGEGTASAAGPAVAGGVAGLQQLLKAVDLGPYGAGVSSSTGDSPHSHRVATMPR